MTMPTPRFFAHACLLVLPASAHASAGPWRLFVQSLDFFTFLLVGVSIAACAVTVRAVIELREARICPPSASRRLEDLSRENDADSLERWARADGSFPARVLAASLPSRASGPDAMLEAGELAASEECAKRFRLLDALNLIGNLAPLIGLAGTVWGMIVAFATIGQAGGQAGAAELSLGVSKALFHTLLGLLVSIPCLSAYAYFKGRAESLCNRALAQSADLVRRCVALYAAGPSDPEPAKRAGKGR